MQNRWGQKLEEKVPSRSSSSNNINININFNNMKEKTNVFAGKKVNNFVQVNSDPKVNISRPNVSMETLKQKKKVIIMKEQSTTQIRRKKSKSKIINDPCTPEKRRNRINEDDKSVSKTNKRTSKSNENLRNFYLRDKKKSKSKSNSNSKYQSRSKSKSKSQSSKKLLKNYSKKKLSQTVKMQTNSTKSKPTEEKHSSKKSKKSSKGDDLKQSVTDVRQVHKIPKKQRKPLEVKPSKSKKFRKKSPNKDDKQLKRPPLVIVDEQQFDEDSEFKKHHRDVHEALYEFDLESNKKEKPLKETIVGKYMKGEHTYNDLKLLTEVARTIERFWKGYKVRKQFQVELALMENKIKIAQKRIDESDPKYWGDDDSRLKISDDSENASDYYPSIKPSQNLSQKRIVMRDPENEIEDKLNKIQAELEEQRKKYNMLEEENKSLKTQLQKVSAQQSYNSPQQNSMNSDRENSQENNDGFVLVLPKKKMKKQEYQEEAEDSDRRKPKFEKPKLEIETNPQHEEEHITKIKTFGDDFCSPKAILNAKYGSLIRKKKTKLEDDFTKKSNMYERMLNDRLFSPRTYKSKKTELEERFQKEIELIKLRTEQIGRVASFLKEIKEEQKIQERVVESEEGQPPQIPETPPLIVEKRQIIKINEQVPEIEQKQNTHHRVEEYPNILITSHRSNQSGVEGEGSKSQEQQLINSNIQQRANQIFNRIVESEKQKQSGDEPQSEVEVEVEGDGSEQQQPPIVERVIGMQTTLHFIKEYCIGFIEYIRNSPDFREQFFNNITSPIKFDLFQFLKAYRTTLANQNDSSYNSLRKQYIYPYFKSEYPKPKIISRESFDEFNQSYDKLQGECNFESQRNYFLNSILDTFNEALDYERPSSIYGESPLWISQSKTLKNHSITNLDPILSMESARLDEACGVAIARLIQWATSLCGFIPQSPEMENIVIDDDQIQTIRETRMALMLEKGLVEDEQKMIDMAVEEVEIKLQLSEVFVDSLVEQLLQQMNWI